MMKIIFTKYAEDGITKTTFEFIVTEVRFAGYLVGINIVDVGWRTVTQEQYDSYIITKL